MKRLFALSIAALLVVVSLSVFVANSAKNPPSIIYKQLASPVDTTCCVVQEYHLITADFATPVPTDATVFVAVTVVQRSPECCPGVFAINLSVDNGPHFQVGGGDTSRVPGIRVTLTAFDRVGFAPGTHSVSVFVFNGGGTWTVDSGRLTSLLIEFN